MSGTGGTILRFKGLIIDVAHNRIDVDGVAHRIEPKPMEVLFVLASRDGEVIDRQTLIDEVWGVAYGGDESLTRAISLLRKVLPNAIRTVSKRGYVFSAEPELQSSAAMPARRGRRLLPWLAGLGGLLVIVVAGLVIFARSPSPSQRSGITLVVRPFVSEGDPDRARVATDSLITALSQFDHVKVRGQGGGEAPDPGKAYVYTVTGVIRMAAGRPVLDVRLQDYVTGDTQWSSSAPYDDHAAATLSATLEPAAVAVTKTRIQAQPVDALSPWELVMLGTWVPGADREWLGPPNANSYWVWDRAIAKDPDFALAHASLSQVMANFALFDPPSDTPAHVQRAAGAADRALQLAPYDAGVLYQIALYDRYAGKRAAAVATLKQVLAQEPDNVAARVELEFAQGQCSAGSTAAAARLRVLDDSLPLSDPRHWVILSRLADMALARGDYVEARENAARSRMIIRQVWSSVTLAAADAALGHASEAREVGLEHRGQWPALDYGRFAEGPLTRWCYGGDTAKAAAAFRKLDRAIKSPGSP